MNKKFLFIIIAGIIALAIFYLTNSISKQLNSENDYKKLPQFTFYNFDGTEFSVTNFYNRNNRIIFCYYHPECDYCINFSNKLKNYKLNSDSTTFFMVSNAADSLIKSFIITSGLNKYPNIIFISDRKSDFYKYFNIKSIPSYFIYKNKILEKKYSGIVKIESLIQI